MENKNVGYLLLGISIVLVGIIFLFNSAMKEIVKTSCGEAHALVCPMNETIKEQTYLSFAIVTIIFVVAFVLVFSKPKERIVLQKIRVKEKVVKKEVDTSGLRKEDKEVLQIVQASKTIFQADLIEKTGFGKAKMSRILDRLENKGIIERKRRGMTNVVVMKD